MSRTIRALLAAAFAVVALGAVAGAAQGFWVASISPAGAITATSLGSLSFQTEALTVSCPMTFEGRLERELAPVEGSDIGRISRVGIGRCANGSVTSVLNLEWYIRNNSDLGELPERATGDLFTIEKAALKFRVNLFGVECLYEGDVDWLAAVTGRNPYTTGLIRSLETRVPLVRAGSSELCPASGKIVGSMSFTVQQRISPLLINYPLQPNLPAVAFHSLAGAPNTYQFTFTNMGMAAQNIISAFMSRGTQYSVPANACEGMIARLATCTATVTKTANPPTSWDAVELANELGLVVGVAYVFP